MKVSTDGIVHEPFIGRICEIQIPTVKVRMRKDRNSSDFLCALLHTFLISRRFKGTTSMFTGEIQNFILSCAYVLPAILYYRKNRTKKGAITGLLLGIIISVVIAIFTNLYLIFPAYIYLYGMSWDQILGICAAVNPYISTKISFVAFSVIPFNLISRCTTSIITFLLYKKISKPIKHFIQE